MLTIRSDQVVADALPIHQVGADAVPIHQIGVEVGYLVGCGIGCVVDVDENISSNKK